ncbi:2Fe-2S ferredoxin [Rhodococcus rhodnii]|uniref:Dioxygenase ferredoxin component n=2 Tax=Rhodococcus rhodnii TaxID=38312 RepID=R7WJ50_9NOCA|nr:Rieske 2Fe-2S domain-containing protein [Rhodococcus rhodnii]EOM75281.1 dioxygenase ferredoxin component [Rhodococcus rhodnii LMG 5362]TXG92087.1 2Fe-2S ferredoxin [Rhodococcus rhodnii]
MADDSPAVATDAAHWVLATTTRELARRRKLRVEVEDEAIALFMAGDRVYAFADVCVHQDRSLAKGTLLHGSVICPGHQWRFDLETGYEPDQDVCQPTFRVRIHDDSVYVDLRKTSDDSPRRTTS